MVRKLLAVLTALVLVVSTAGAASAVTDPTSGPYPQVHGEMVTDVPSTPACTTTIVSGYDFHNTAYGADPPFTGDYVPSCAGPWAKVVLTMSVAVKTGTQFDRIGDVLIGGAELLHPTTAEGEAGETDWTISRDVTPYASLFTTEQPTYFIIGNQTDGTYTGDFYGTLSLTFYAADATTPAAIPADLVIGMNHELDRGLPTRSGDKPVTTAVTIPQNTTGLTAELFASGHGAEEEDWWNAPYACASGGIPYREVGISVDGQLAGVAPVFPTIYTGGYGPDFWRPIPSPRAYNMRPYDFDLSPWIGQLTDGKPHSLAINAIGQGGCDGYWFLGSNLLVSTNRISTARTVGAITSYTGDALPTNTTSGTQGAASDMTTSAHHLDVVASLQPAAASEATVVHVVQDMTNTATDAAIDVESSWTWNRSTTRTVGGHTGEEAASATYMLLRTGPTWTLQDDDAVTDTSDGATVGSSTLTDTMNSVGPVVGVTGAAGSQTESWKFSESSGYCRDHELASAVQNTVQDTVTDCGTTPTATPAPGPTRAPRPYDQAATGLVRRSDPASRARRLLGSLRATG